MNSSLIIPYGLSAPDRPALFLEGEPPDPLAGVVTGSLVVSHLLASILGGAVRQPSCGGRSGDEYETTLYAYPADPLLDYEAGLSWGVLGRRLIEEVVIREVIEFTMAATATLKYPSRSLYRQTWLGDCFDRDGGFIATPSLTIAGQTVSVGRACYGAALVEHLVVRHRYSVRLAKRVDAGQPFFSAIAWAVWQNGYTSLELSAEELSDQEGPCGGMNLSHIPPDQRRYVPRFAWADQQIDVNYCDQVADKPVITSDEEWGWERS